MVPRCITIHQQLFIPLISISEINEAFSFSSDMDFHSFSRRTLQGLCKKNKIPANMTNVAMAEALENLPTVDGMDEIQDFMTPMKKAVATP
ncbi:hypothetical protein ZOSMA_18G01390 [Zostera marina]|uniref:Uncharacterized protein n=1 Tax=Zostera marina TaxID=29655 RepID=A0A0K9PPZ7_ZOSMR|nr:hypothetical protein ZOSMA_18G01390 [Zostera marina]